MTFTPGDPGLPRSGPVVVKIVVAASATARQPAGSPPAPARRHWTVGLNRASKPVAKPARFGVRRPRCGCHFWKGPTSQPTSHLKPKAIKREQLISALCFCTPAPEASAASIGTSSGRFGTDGLGLANGVDLGVAAAHRCDRTCRHRRRCCRLTFSLSAKCLIEALDTRGRAPKTQQPGCSVLIFRVVSSRKVSPHAAVRYRNRCSTATPGALVILERTPACPPHPPDHILSAVTR